MSPPKPTKACQRAFRAISCDGGNRWGTCSVTVFWAIFSSKRALLFGALLLCCGLVSSVSQAQIGAQMHLLPEQGSATPN